MTTTRAEIIGLSLLLGATALLIVGLLVGAVVSFVVGIIVAIAGDPVSIAAFVFAAFLGFLGTLMGGWFLVVPLQSWKEEWARWKRRDA